MKYTKAEIFGLSILTLIGAALLYMGVSIAHAGEIHEDIGMHGDVCPHAPHMTVYVFDDGKSICVGPDWEPTFATREELVQDCIDEVELQYEDDSEELRLELIQECETDTM